MMDKVKNKESNSSGCHVISLLFIVFAYVYNDFLTPSKKKRKENCEKLFDSTLLIL